MFCIVFRLLQAFTIAVTRMILAYSQVERSTSTSTTSCCFPILPLGPRTNAMMDLDTMQHLGCLTKPLKLKGPAAILAAKKPTVPFPENPPKVHGTFTIHKGSWMFFPLTQGKKMERFSMAAMASLPLKI